MNEFETERFAGLLETILEQGEPVTVVFGDASTREILALVYRERIVRVPEARETDRPVISLLFCNESHGAIWDTTAYPELWQAQSANAVTDAGGLDPRETLFDRNLMRFVLPRRIGIPASLMDGKGFKIKNIPVQLECGMLVEL